MFCMERINRIYSIIVSYFASILLYRLKPLFFRAVKGSNVNLLGGLSAVLLGMVLAMVLTACNSRFQTSDLPVKYEPMAEVDPSKAILFKDHVSYNKKKFSVSNAELTPMANDKSFELEAKISLNNEPKLVKLKGFSKTDKKNEFLFTSEDQTIKSKLTCLNLNESDNQVSCTQGFFDFYYLSGKETFIHDQYVLGNATAAKPATPTTSKVATNSPVAQSVPLVAAPVAETTALQPIAETAAPEATIPEILAAENAYGGVATADTDYEKSGIEDEIILENAKAGAYVGNQDSDVMELFPEIAAIIKTKLPVVPAMEPLKQAASTPVKVATPPNTTKPAAPVISAPQPKPTVAPVVVVAPVVTPTPTPKVTVATVNPVAAVAPKVKPKQKPEVSQIQVPNQLGSGVTKITDQVIGYSTKGSLENATNLFDLSNADNGSFFKLLAPGKKRYFGTFDMGSLLKFLGEFVRSKLKNSGLVVGDVSQEKGGAIYSLNPKTKKYELAHSGHEAGMDADVSYIVAKNSLIFNSVLGKEAGKLDPDFLLKDQWELFKVGYQTGLIDITFLDEKIKGALCKMALQNNEINSYKDEKSFAGQVLSRLIPWPGHHHHFHVRMKCTKNQPRCRQTIYDYKGTGCS